jgi:nucleoside-diphosphate-sugar epimerase
MIIVTGGAGFIGADTVHELNGFDITEILIVDRGLVRGPHPREHGLQPLPPYGVAINSH